MVAGQELAVRPGRWDSSLSAIHGPSSLHPAPPGNGSSSSTTITRSTPAANSSTHPGRDRPHHPQLRGRERSGEPPHPHVLVDHAAGDDPQGAGRPLDAVVRMSRRTRPTSRCAPRSWGRRRARPPHGGHELPAGRAASVRPPHHRPAADRTAPPATTSATRALTVRKITGSSNCSLSTSADADEILGLLAVGGLQHRHLGEPGVVAVVLLVLRAEHARIVGRDDRQRHWPPCKRRT